jgi:O-acetyl-ADP-ribose deacetylase (regulator of RNase III)
MKIEYIEGDLFETDIKHILHGCNAKGVMGGGVAAIVRAKFPAAYKAYIDHMNKHGLKLGEIILAEQNGKVIINAITQENFGGGRTRYVSYDAVAEVMRKVNELGIQKVAMPLVGAGLAGGDWFLISKIIEKELTKVRPYVYVLPGTII